MKTSLTVLLTVVLCWMANTVESADPVSAKDIDSSSVKDPSLDITRVDISQTVDHRIVFCITYSAPPDANRLRIMLDVDGSRRGEPGSGADFMLEGLNFYHYPDGATDWTWDAIEPPFITADGRTLTCVLPDVSALTRVRWFVETTRPDWITADRLPQAGTLEFLRENLPVIELQTKLFPEDIGEFVTNAPPSLCFRFDSELKSRIWKTAPAAEKPMAWKPVCFATALPLRFVLSDAVTHESAKLEADKTFSAGNYVQWTGKSLGIDWVLVSETMENGDIQLTGQLQAGGERCVRVGVGCELNSINWTWHDDVRRRRIIRMSNQYANAVACPFGMSGSRSIYPFGVISSGGGSLIAETEIDEPRVYQIVADARDSFFGVYYDFGLTPLTSNFPNRAAFRCVLRSSLDRGDDAFRRALSAFYDRNPAFFKREVPKAGLWLAFTDPGAISNVQDFGFAFFERSMDGTPFDLHAVPGLLFFGCTEPWLYWLSIPSDVKRTEAEAVRRMKFLAAGGDRRAELAASALLGAARRPDGSYHIQFLDVPRNSGARLEVNTDPDSVPTAAAPITRAMSEWREARRILADDRMSGICLDSLAGAHAADYNPAAIAVADYPCAFETNVLKPCLPMEWAEFEYTAAISRAMKARGKFVMGNFACADSPFFAKHVDVPGEEVEWNAGGLDARLANFERAMSGRKPFSLLLNTAFGKLTGDSARRYFEDCMFWGFLPGFFSRDGLHDSYWTNPTGYNRDRPLFKTYVPLIRRLAAGGWQPVGDVTAQPATIWVECFGSSTSGVRQITLRNYEDAVVKAELAMKACAEPVVVINPLDAECDVIESNQTKCAMSLPAVSIETRDLVPASALGGELDFARAWRSGNGESEICVKVLESVRDELNAGALCNVSHSLPAIRNGTNVFHLAIRNIGNRRLQIGDIKVISSKRFRPFEIQLNEVDPGAALLFHGFFTEKDMGENPWLEIQWTLRDGPAEWLCTRVIHPQYPAADLQLFRSRVRR